VSKKLTREQIAEIEREVVTMRDAILAKKNESPDPFRRAMIDLLRNNVPINMPLSQYMRDRMANELERLWWPKGGRPALVPPETLCYFVDTFETFNRERRVDRPRTTALEQARGHFGYCSVEGVRKAMQPSRNRKPRG
jgi:hypothetical protein